MSRPGLCWRWLACCQYCPLAPVRGVAAHEQLARRCCSVAMVAVVARSSFVSVALILLNSVTACLSDAVSVYRCASASDCCCCMYSITAALACPPLMQCAPYPSDANVRGWTQISRNSCAKKCLESFPRFVCRVLTAPLFDAIVIDACVFH